MGVDGVVAVLDVAVVVLRVRPLAPEIMLALLFALSGLWCLLVVIGVGLDGRLVGPVAGLGIGLVVVRVGPGSPINCQRFVHFNRPSNAYLVSSE